jgi:ubiquinone/menaquinone biosynthesis C-methylase UbiE
MGRNLTRRERLAVASVPFVLWGALVAWQFPYATDDPVRREDEIAAFYQLAYSPSIVKDTQLAKDASNAKIAFNIAVGVEQFVRSFRLERAKVLDVGSGTGYLQDVVDDYTGFDIAKTVAYHYHKPFVAGTATAMPFEDDMFDVAWSIWVLEHIPNPEAALREIRRVVKSGGYLYLQPAWDCKPWAAQGYEARPYSDFSLSGKIVKASIPLRQGYSFWFFSTVPVRLIRSLATAPTRLHYRRLSPNYAEYWQADSDAVNTLDSAEMAQWFESRGDSCLNCLPTRWRIFQAGIPLIIRVNKSR